MMTQSATRPPRRAEFRLSRTSCKVLYRICRMSLFMYFVSFSNHRCSVSSTGVEAGASAIVRNELRRDGLDVDDAVGRIVN